MRADRLVMCVAMALLMFTPAVHAAVRTQEVEYLDGETRLKGYVAWDDAVEGKRPGVLVVHEWWGLNDYAQRRARMLAEQGYVAFALDMYGQGKVTQHPKEAGQWAATIRENSEAWRRRARAGFEALRARPEVDADRCAAIGYCFGGATTMQMAYAGLPVRGVVSFHGSLPVATEAEAKLVKQNGVRVLVCHGSSDSFIPKPRVQEFMEALDKGGVDYQFIHYSNALHGFTNPDAGKYGVPGLAHQPEADRRSWASTLDFLAETLRAKP